MINVDAYRTLPPPDAAMKHAWRLVEHLGLDIQQVYRGPAPDHLSFVGYGLLRDGQAMILKASIRLPGDTIEEKIRDFENERILYTAATSLTNRAVRDALPSLAAQGEFEGKKWFMYHHLGGQTFGGPLFLRDALAESWSQPLIDFILGLHAATPEVVPHLAQVVSRSSSFYRAYLEEKVRDHWADVSHYYPGGSSDVLFGLLEEAEESLNGAEYVLSHGDLHPANFFETSPTSFKVIDWEKIHIGNPLADAAYLWIRFWRAPWRDTLLKQILNMYPTRQGWQPLPVLRYLVASQLMGELHSWQKETRWPRFPMRHEIDNVLALYAADLQAAISGTGIFGEDTQKRQGK